jgi:prepilin-type N-terminal cleavage/methylation domain-containing protein
MMTPLKQRTGFTLVETLVVVLILAVVTSAVYSLYLTHLKTSYSQDDVVEVQQNLRIALDAITRDIKLAGMLVPVNTPTGAVPPLQNGYGNFSTCLGINTVSAEGRLARVMHKTLTPGTLDNYTTSVEAPPGNSGFSVGDRVRVVKTFDSSPCFTSYSALMVTAASSSSNYMELKRPGGGLFPAGVSISVGDIIAKINSPAVASYPAHLGANAYNTVLYRMVNSATTSTCPAGLCLARQVNPAKPPQSPLANEIVASNLSRLSITYLVANRPETSNPVGSETDIKAVRITLAGTTTKSTGAGWVPKTRQLTSVIMLRNSRRSP